MTDQQMMKKKPSLNDSLKIALSYLAHKTIFFLKLGVSVGGNMID